MTTPTSRAQDPMNWVAVSVHEDDPPPEQVYALVQDGNGQGWVEAWPRDEQGYGAITAITRAAHLSLHGDPVEVLLPDGRLLARFVGGAREGRTRPLRAPVRTVE